VTKTNPEDLQRKYDYEKTYQELVNMAHNTSCVSANVMTELNETYANLKKESIKDLAADLP